MFGTPLHYAAKEKDAKYDIAKILLDQGANPNVRNSKGCIPLHYAVTRKDVNIVDRYGNTPLHFAAEEKDVNNIVEILLKYGSNVNAKNRCGETPLHFAALVGNITTTLHMYILNHMSPQKSKNWIKSQEILYLWGARPSSGELVTKEKLQLLLSYCDFIRGVIGGTEHTTNTPTLQVAAFKTILSSLKGAHDLIKIVVEIAVEAEIVVEEPLLNNNPSFSFYFLHKIFNNKYPTTTIGNVLDHPESQPHSSQVHERSRSICTLM